MNIPTANTLSRSEEKVAAMHKQLASTKDNISSYVCNLASFSQIRRFAEAVKSDHASIDVLVNNAGVFEERKILSDDGFDMGCKCTGAIPADLPSHGHCHPLHYQYFLHLSRQLNGFRQSEAGKFAAQLLEYFICTFASTCRTTDCAVVLHIYNIISPQPKTVENMQQGQHTYLLVSALNYT